MLLSHMEDLIVRAESGSTVHSDFLNLGEQYLIRTFLAQCGKTEGADWMFYGGYPFAERCMLFLFPEYIAETAAITAKSMEVPMTAQQNCRDLYPAAASALLSFCQEANSISAVCVSGSGYRHLTHRDYLGSLLSLGMERSVIGDIAVTDDCHAVIFLKTRFCAYLQSALERIGNDKVKISTITKEEAEKTPDSRRYEILSDTVASLRLDAVIAAACHLSREKAKQLVSSGAVEVDFRQTDAQDTELAAGTVLSIHGYGRYVLEAIDGTSKKGRLRIRMKKFI